MKVEKKYFGTLGDSTECSLYKISNDRMFVCVTDYGCTLTGIFLPNKLGGYDDMILGPQTLEGFVSSPGFSFGSIVGRFANRIGGASYTVDGTTYQLDKNDNAINTLHGGYFRYDHVRWDAKIVENADGSGVEFTRRSADGEQGFGGNVDLTVTYTLNDKNELKLKYKAVTDKETPVNLTNHAYFNLHGCGTVLDHQLQMDCDSYLEVDKNLIPDGKLIAAKDNAFDFHVMKAIGRDIEKVAPGYDHCYVTPCYKNGKWEKPSEDNLCKAAVLADPATGRVMEVYTDQPGMQVYTANWIGGIVGKLGIEYKRHDAVCLETQAFPDAPNKKDFPNCYIKPGEEYKAVTIYKFDF
ncbi:MAG: galactose mutarotase [Treponema sp.]|nr:galactose mutarotase [Treponema sp.]